MLRDEHGCGEAIDGEIDTSFEMSRDSSLLTVQELAARLKVSSATVYYWRFTLKDLPCISVGKHLRFEWSKVLAYFSDKSNGGEGDSLLISPARIKRKALRRGSLKTKDAGHVHPKKGKEHGDKSI